MDMLIYNKYNGNILRIVFFLIFFGDCICLFPQILYVIQSGTERICSDGLKTHFAAIV